MAGIAVLASRHELPQQQQVLSFQNPCLVYTPCRCSVQDAADGRPRGRSSFVWLFVSALSSKIWLYRASAARDTSIFRSRGMGVRDSLLAMMMLPDRPFAWTKIGSSWHITYVLWFNLQGVGLSFETGNMPFSLGSHEGSELNDQQLWNYKSQRICFCKTLLCSIMVWPKGAYNIGFKVHVGIGESVNFVHYYEQVPARKNIFFNFGN